MLRITRSEPGDSIHRLALEGKLLAPWVGELVRACEASALACGRLQLDLSALTYADSAGVRLLEQLIAEGVTIIACSGFVAELLDRHSR